MYFIRFGELFEGINFDSLSALVWITKLLFEFLKNCIKILVEVFEHHPQSSDWSISYSLGGYANLTPKVAEEPNS